MEEEELKNGSEVEQVDSQSANDETSGARSTQKGLIGFWGARGIPANYSGFETVIEEISNSVIITPTCPVSL